MPIGPTTYFGKERVFVDREPCIQAFRENIQNLGTQEYNVLFYYGIAGIGKSKLQKKLQNILNEEYPEIVWVAIDLNTKTYREIGTFLITLRNKIQEKCDAKFYLFNTIHAIYWKKLHPEIPLQKENYPLIKEGGFFSKIIDVLDEFGPVRLTWDIINNAPDNVRKIFKGQALDINKLASMEAPEIEKLLPGFFAEDFTSYLGTNSKAYIFIDTYEALWEGIRNKGSFHEKDEWIRDNLIPNMQRVSWVISGREKLLWASECDPDWKMYLEQHSVDELPESYCTEFLEDCDIENKDIRDIIIKASEGVPYYLNLSVDTFEKINKKRQPVSEDFGKTQPEIFNTFVKYLEGNEIRALEILSAPNFWDRDLFEILMKKFDTGFPAGAFSELIKFSFIKKDTEGKFSIHQLMRRSLQEHQDSTDRINAHQFLLAYYSNKIEDIDIKAITPEHEIALTEAFYHAKESLEVEDLYEWFIEYSAPFYDATFWNLLYPVYEELLQILNKEMKTYHPAIANVLFYLGSIFSNMGKFKEANQKYENAQRIYEKLIEEEPEKEIYYLKAGKTLTHLGSLLRSQGNLIDARTKVGDALEVYFELGRFTSKNETYFSHLGEAFSCLGNILADSGEQKRAEECYKDTTKIYNYLLERSPNNVAYLLQAGLIYNNLGTLFLDIGRLGEAKDMLENSFRCYDKLLNKYQNNNVYKNILGGILNNLGSSLYCSDKLYEAKQKYENALEIHIKLSENDPENPMYKLNLLETLVNLGSVLAHLRQLEESEIKYKKSLQILDELIEWRPNDPNFRFYLGAIFTGCGDLFSQKGQSDKARQNYEKAIGIYEKLVTEYPMNVKYQFSLGSALNNLGNLFFEMRRYNEALLHYKQSLIYIGGSMGKSHQYFKKIESNIKNAYRFCNKAQ